MTDERDRGPRAIAEALNKLLKSRGLDKDVARASVLEEWAEVVGPQIAAVTRPRLIAADGTLTVGVTTHAWMNELSLMERSLMAKMNASGSRVKVTRIRWELLR